MASYLKQRHMQFIVLANKADKIKPAMFEERLEDVRSKLQLDGSIKVIAFSSQSGVGKDAAVREITTRLEAYR
jgi:GTP-binding protein EngB required for normal cell division